MVAWGWWWEKGIINGQEGPYRDNENGPQLDYGDNYKAHKNHWIMQLKWFDFTICKLYFNKVLIAIKNKVV